MKKLLSLLLFSVLLIAAVPAVHAQDDDDDYLFADPSLTPEQNQTAKEKRLSQKQKAAQATADVINARDNAQNALENANSQKAKAQADSQNPALSYYGTTQGGLEAAGAQMQQKNMNTAIAQITQAQTLAAQASADLTTPTRAFDQDVETIILQYQIIDQIATQRSPSAGALRLKKQSERRVIYIAMDKATSDNDRDTLSRIEVSLAEVPILPDSDAQTLRRLVKDLFFDGKEIPNSPRFKGAASVRIGNLAATASEQDIRNSLGVSSSVGKVYDSPSVPKGSTKANTPKQPVQSTSLISEADKKIVSSNVSKLKKLNVSSGSAADIRKAYEQQADIQRALVNKLLSVAIPGSQEAADLAKMRSQLSGASGWNPSKVNSKRLYEIADTLSKATRPVPVPIKTE